MTALLQASDRPETEECLDVDKKIVSEMNSLLKKSRVQQDIIELVRRSSLVYLPA